jgi:hypothetical protein
VFEAPIGLDDLWAFCNDRLDDDAAVARAATPGPWAVDDASHAEAIHAANGAVVVGGGRWGGEASVFDSTEDALHIARHNPTRVLADVTFKRELLAEHEPVLQAAVKDDEVTPMLVCRVDGLDCPFAQGLAALYDDHPDYKEAWRP